MMTYKGSFTISGTSFTFNHADSNGGVMNTYKSLFSITDSTFSYNRAEMESGVIHAVDSSFTPLVSVEVLLLTTVLIFLLVSWTYLVPY